MNQVEVEDQVNTLVDLKRFFTKEGETMTTAEWKAEWDQLSDEEKHWFKTQPLD